MANKSKNLLKTPRIPWHANSVEFALTSLETSPLGLSDHEAASRLMRYGPNVIERKVTDGPLKILWHQINNPLIWVLIASAALAMALGKATDGLVVAAVVVLNSMIGFLQEFKAGKAIEALISLVPENAIVLRNNRKITIPASQVVPGDIVLLASGDKIPADLRFMQTRNLQIEEAALTGESLPVQKQIEEVELKVSLGDRLNMAYSSTMVTYGTGTGVVVATGMATELGRISEMMHQTTDFQTPLTKALAAVAHHLTYWIMAITVVLVSISLWRGFPFADALLVGVTLAVAAIPEGLPAVVTIALAIGVQRMARKRAIVRKLPAVETLGSTTVICTDKTGTLTRNEMTVQAIWTVSGHYSVSGVGFQPNGELLLNGAALNTIPEDVKKLLLGGILCNDAALVYKNSTWTINGDPTEGALIVAAEKLGLAAEELRESHTRVDVVPFESEYKYMATLNTSPDGSKLSYLKGAPEIILRRCAKLSNGENLNPKEILAKIEQFASQGMRVLAVASKQISHSRNELGAHDIENGFSLLGLFGMIDPPRTEAIEAVKRCHNAGIIVKMITGDHKGTAQAIGQEIGLLNDEEAINGAQIDSLSNEEFRDAALRCNVFARVAPEHKLRLVQALQGSQQIVAMTGDGVNDAPALKQANIGVAMGITGTAVSKEAADIVLTDDNFSSIASAVEEGRRVYDNLLKSLIFLLPTNLGLAFILMFAVLFFPLQNVDGRLVPLMPMLPTQILWINLIAAVALALPLGFEAKEPNIMARPPRSPNEPLLSRFVTIRTIAVALLMAAAAIGVFYYEYASLILAQGGDYTENSFSTAMRTAQTEAVTTVVIFQIFYLLDCRSLRFSIFRMGLFTNFTIYIGIAVVSLLQLGFIYSNFMQKLFNTTSLSLNGLWTAFLIGAAITPIIILEKSLRKLTDKSKK